MRNTIGIARGGRRRGLREGFRVRREVYFWRVGSVAVLKVDLARGVFGVRLEGLGWDYRGGTRRALV